MKYLWLDDTREMPSFLTEKSGVHCRTAREAIDYLNANWDDIRVIDLDHDLGHSTEDGMTVLNYIEEQLFTGQRENIHFNIHIHTMNPVEHKIMFHIAMNLMSLFLVE